EAFGQSQKRAVRALVGIAPDGAELRATQVFEFHRIGRNAERLRGGRLLRQQGQRGAYQPERGQDRYFLGHRHLRFPWCCEDRRSGWLYAAASDIIQIDWSDDDYR